MCVCMLVCMYMCMCMHLHVIEREEKDKKGREGEKGEEKGRVDREKRLHCWFICKNTPVDIAWEP